MQRELVVRLGRDDSGEPQVLIHDAMGAQRVYLTEGETMRAVLVVEPQVEVRLLDGAEGKSPLVVCDAQEVGGRQLTGTELELIGRADVMITLEGGPLIAWSRPGKRGRLDLPGLKQPEPLAGEPAEPALLEYAWTVGKDPSGEPVPPRMVRTTPVQEREEPAPLNLPAEGTRQRVIFDAVTAFAGGALLSPARNVALGLAAAIEKALGEDPVVPEPLGIDSELPANTVYPDQAKAGPGQEVKASYSIAGMHREALGGMNYSFPEGTDLAEAIKILTGILDRTEIAAMLNRSGAITFRAVVVAQRKDEDDSPGESKQS